MAVEVNQYRGDSQQTGKNVAFDNRPLYYELAFIIKL